MANAQKLWLKGERRVILQELYTDIGVLNVRRGNH